MAVFSLSNAHLAFGHVALLDNAAFSLDTGERLGLIGRNGAGKSTALKCLIGLVPAAAGEIAFDGHAIRGLDPFRISRLGLGYVPEERRIFADLTVAENLEVGRHAPRPGRP